MAVLTSTGIVRGIFGGFVVFGVVMIAGRLGKDLPPPVPLAQYEDEVGRCKHAQDLRCYIGYLERVTAESGPEQSLALLARLVADGLVAKSADVHQFAHLIGRKTAAAIGEGGEAFLRCDTSFNYGCEHGFLEYVLKKHPSPKLAIEAICGTIEKETSYSEKFKFYCYHGVGHGVLMAESYDYKRGLEICDSLPTATGRQGCSQGLFMEGANAAIRGGEELDKGVFSAADPLLPCAALENKYQYECFINHGGWLATVFRNDIAEAAASCASAPSPHKHTCAHSIGLLLTNSAWLYAISRSSPLSGEELRASVALCDRFPGDLKPDCYRGALDNLMNDDGTALPGRAVPFCNLLPPDAQESCFFQIGVNIARQVVRADNRRELCGRLPSHGAAACLRGIR
jgi:hypothetical protein